MYYRSRIPSLNRVVFLLDGRGRFTYLSPACWHISGYAPADLIGGTISSVVVPEDQERVCKKFQEVRRGNSYPSDYRIMTKDGTIRSVRSVSHPYADIQGNPGVIGIISEIRTWQITGEALWQSEQNVKRIVECSDDGILLTDETGSIVEWNPALERSTGFLRFEIIGRKIWDVQFDLVPDHKKTPEYAEYVKKLFLPLLSGGRPADPEHRFGQEFQHRDTTVRTIESLFFPVPTENGSMIGGILRDITDCKRSENAMQEANRKLNLLSSITRHDVSNQLTIINGYLSLFEIGSPAMKSSDTIRVLQGAAGRIQRILTFTKEYQDVGFKSPSWQVLGETIASAKSMIETGPVGFTTGMSCERIEVFADPMLARVFYNLIDNSLRHGENVSQIQISCSLKNGQLLIIYEDDGVGIADRIRPRLFDRGTGKNSGYGLFLIHEILAITGFAITETGLSGRGARFEITVPSGSFRTAGEKKPQK